MVPLHSSGISPLLSPPNPEDPQLLLQIPKVPTSTLIQPLTIAPTLKPTSNQYPTVKSTAPRDFSHSPVPKTTSAAMNVTAEDMVVSQHLHSTSQHSVKSNSSDSSRSSSSLSLASNTDNEIPLLIQQDRLIVRAKNGLIDNDKTLENDSSDESCIVTESVITPISQFDDMTCHTISPTTTPTNAAVYTVAATATGTASKFHCPENTAFGSFEKDLDACGSKELGSQITSSILSSASSILSSSSSSIGFDNDSDNEQNEENNKENECTQLNGLEIVKKQSSPVVNQYSTDLITAALAPVIKHNHLTQTKLSTSTGAETRTEIENGTITGKSLQNEKQKSQNVFVTRNSRSNLSLFSKNQNSKTRRFVSSSKNSESSETLPRSHPKSVVRSKKRSSSSSLCKKKETLSSLSSRKGFGSSVFTVGSTVADSHFPAKSIKPTETRANLKSKNPGSGSRSVGNGKNTNQYDGPHSDTHLFSSFCARCETQFDPEAVSDNLYCSSACRRRDSTVSELSGFFNSDANSYFSNSSLSTALSSSYSHFSGPLNKPPHQQQQQQQLYNSRNYSAASTDPTSKCHCMDCQKCESCNNNPYDVTSAQKTSFGSIYNTDSSKHRSYSVSTFLPTTNPTTSSDLYSGIYPRKKSMAAYSGGPITSYVAPPNPAVAAFTGYRSGYDLRDTSGLRRQSTISVTSPGAGFTGTGFSGLKNASVGPKNTDSIQQHQPHPQNSSVTMARERSESLSISGLDALRRPSVYSASKGPQTPVSLKQKVSGQNSVAARHNSISIAYCHNCKSPIALNSNLNLEPSASTSMSNRGNVTGSSSGIAETNETTNVEKDVLLHKKLATFSFTNDRENSAVGERVDKKVSEKFEQKTNDFNVKPISFYQPISQYLLESPSESLSRSPSQSTIEPVSETTLPTTTTTKMAKKDQKLPTELLLMSPCEPTTCLVVPNPSDFHTYKPNDPFTTIPTTATNTLSFSFPDPSPSSFSHSPFSSSSPSVLVKPLLTPLPHRHKSISVKYANMVSSDYYDNNDNDDNTFTKFTKTTTSNHNSKSLLSPAFYSPKSSTPTPLTNQQNDKNVSNFFNNYNVFNKRNDLNNYNGFENSAISNASFSQSKSLASEALIKVLTKYK